MNKLKQILKKFWILLLIIPVFGAIGSYTGYELYNNLALSAFFAVIAGLIIYYIVVAIYQIKHEETEGWVMLIAMVVFIIVAVVMISMSTNNNF